MSNIGELYPRRESDRAKAAKPKRGRLQQIAAFIGYMLAGALAGYFMASEGLIDWLLPDGSGGWFIIGALLSLWPNIVLHEIGHVLAGWLAGMRLVVAGVGPWRLQKRGGRWRVFRVGGIAGLGGFAAMAPVGDKPLALPATIFYGLGGIAINLLTASLCVGWILWQAPEPLLHGLLVGVAGIALLYAVANLLPISMAGWQSDGKLVLGLLRGDADARAYVDLQRYSGLSMAGVRPRDWPPALHPQPTLQPAQSLAGRLHELVYAQWRLDAPDSHFDAALAARIVEHHAELPDGMHQYASLVMADYAARIARDADLLAAWRAECTGGLIDLSLHRAWIDAALARLRGQHSALPALLDTAEALLPNAPDPASQIIMAERLAGLRAALDAENTRV